MSRDWVLLMGGRGADVARRLILVSNEDNESTHPLAAVVADSKGQGVPLMMLPMSWPVMTSNFLIGNHVTRDENQKLRAFSV